MDNYYHQFHIPVMGTGHSIDTPIRVAPFGISSVISIVDDVLIEKIRKYYCELYDLPFDKIRKSDDDSRARRITAYLDVVKEIVNQKVDEIRDMPFFESNVKSKYFEMLPDLNALKVDYKKLFHISPGPERDSLAQKLNDRIQPGSIDVNIMAKVDRINFDKVGNVLSDEFSDAKAALRGYANSALKSSVVISAGLNQGLLSYMTHFKDFYRNEMGEIKKKIVLKVSDFRSALIQGKFLAKKGLEVFEFRIESGLNCGGHAFPSNGILLPSLLQEFREKRDELAQTFRPFVERYYEKMGWEYPASAVARPLVTVQGGIGTAGEAQRLLEQFGMDLTGWASPFLLVPEATPIDDPTRELVRDARQEDLYLSEASPLGVPFNNIRNSGSERWTRDKSQTEKPGSTCPRGFLVSNVDFTDKPICVASTEYQLQRLQEISGLPVSDEAKKELEAHMHVKTCLCDHLGNGALIALGIARPEKSPQAICPGPNVAWFDRFYTLQEMVDHIYGRIASLVPAERPHMFATEIKMYVDYFEKMLQKSTDALKDGKTLREFKENLEASIEFCREIARGKAYPDENLSSILEFAEREWNRLQTLFSDFDTQLQPAATSA